MRTAPVTRGRSRRRGGSSVVRLMSIQQVAESTAATEAVRNTSAGDQQEPRTRRSGKWSLCAVVVGLGSGRRDWSTSPQRGTGLIAPESVPDRAEAQRWWQRTDPDDEAIHRKPDGKALRERNRQAAPLAGLDSSPAGRPAPAAMPLHRGRHHVRWRSPYTFHHYSTPGAHLNHRTSLMGTTGCNGLPDGWGTRQIPRSGSGSDFHPYVRLL